MRNVELPGGRLVGQAIWRAYAARCDGKTWTRPMLLPGSAGDMAGAVSQCRSKPSRLWAAYTGDGRTFAKPDPINANIRVARLPTGKQTPVRVHLTPAKTPEPKRRPSPPQRPAHQIEIDGKRYELLWGDLHRHTAISWDGAYDGSLEDLYRYALDAASLDFVAVTDHGAGQHREYPWWLTQKSADMFLIPNRFTPLFGYERSLRYPFGHRNIIQRRRGHRPIPPFRQAGGSVGDIAPNDTQRLWQLLDPADSITIPHTTATRMGTNWQEGPSELEPLVELYQGFRNSYESPGAPKTPPPDAPGGVTTDGYVSAALAQRFRLGFIASSDHRSSHVAFAAVYAENRSRDAIFDALRARRTYAATDFIVLDVRMGEHTMGEELRTTELPSLQVHAAAAAAAHNLLRADVIRNGKVVYTIPLRGKRADFTFRDTRPLENLSYYYVRVIQRDPAYRDKTQMAWSSPIWVHYAGEAAGKPR